ncbi:MAG: permease-like cell division protein FtsX [Thiobacillus sp.]|nr:permease-like cell division protein FtsX [Thiobacillus sp.]
MRTWLRHQLGALQSALTRLAAQPVAALLTALAMGVAISLPAGLYLALDNLGRLAGSLPAQPEISLFLDPAAPPGARQAIEARLKRPDIAHARLVGRDEALAALAAAQDLGDVVAGLPENPLPDAWIVQPQDTSRAALARLARALGKLPGVSEARLDSAWAERLAALIAIGHTVVWLLAALFAVALAAIAGNAIRAQVLARRDEIQVSRLIGATDRHIRRPFLYLGAIQGLLGGLAAAGVLSIAGWVLQEPVARLAGLYGSTFHLAPPGLPELAVVLGLPAVFGWLGAWTSVARSLRQVEPPR